MCLLQNYNYKFFFRFIEKSGPYENNPIGAVAVSGGSDSLALVLILDKWIKQYDGKVIALTVDHGLREHSANEARQVGGWLKKYSIEHHILSWDGIKPFSNVQEIARKKRYDLLTNWCKSNNVMYLFTAHNQGDQIETFFDRLQRGSGIDGLSSMPRIQYYNNIQVLRPLLHCTKEHMRSFLREIRQDWIEDPSNNDEKYTRVKIRNKINDILQDQQLFDYRVFNAVNHIARVRSSIEKSTVNKMAKAVKLFNEGYCYIDTKQLGLNPDEENLRIIAEAIKVIGGKEEKTRFKKLLLLYDKIKSKSKFAHTLAGCQIIQDNNR
jgi:tRNA(Ile)-lysidine synthase